MKNPLKTYEIKYNYKYRSRNSWMQEVNWNEREGNE